MRRALLLSATLLACEAPQTGLDPVDLPRPQPVPPGVRCELAPDVRIISNELYEPSASPPIAAGDRVFLAKSGTTGTNSPTDQELFVLDLSSDEEQQLTANNVDDFLIDAGSSDSVSALILRGDREQGYSLLLQGEENTRSIYNDYPHRSLEPLSDMLTYEGGERRLVSNLGVTFAVEDEVYVWNVESRRKISEGRELSAQPSIDGSRVTWSAYIDGQAEIFYLIRDEVQRLTDNDTQDIAPMFSEDRLFWLSDRALMMADLSGERPVVQTLHEGPCAPPSADEGEAVFICGGTATPAPGGALFHFDGERVQQVAEGGYLHAARLRSGRVLWAQYDEPDAFCQGSFDGGEIMIKDLRTTQPTLSLGEVGTPCYCCGAYWPPLYLDLSENAAVWSYARAPNEEGRSFGYGLARLSDCAP